MIRTKVVVSILDLHLIFLGNNNGSSRNILMETYKIWFTYKETLWKVTALDYRESFDNLEKLVAIVLTNPSFSRW